MSNYLAIATVTASLQKVLQEAVQNDVEGARATTAAPSSMASGLPETGVNIFLYQVVSNPSLANADSTPFRSKGTPLNRQAALDLYYMMSCYGNDAELQPQRILGSVVRTMNDRRILTPELIRQTCNDPTFPYLVDSDLEDYVQQINIVPINLTLEDLSKTWSVFYQTPYVLSIAYKVLVVIIEGDEGFKRALPVRDRNSGNLTPFPAQPKVEQVYAQTGKLDPILADSTLSIKGRNLRGSVTEVRIGDVRVTPTEVKEHEIILPLSSVPIGSLYAGVQSLQVIHRALTSADAGSRLTSGVESNVAPFVLCPSITKVTVTEVEEHDELRSAMINVLVDLAIGKKQRVVLALNEWSISNPVSYMFDREPLVADTHSVSIPIAQVKPGEYLVRIRIDGAESKIGVDTDPNSPTFEWFNSPKITIS
ncbi:DUF4255 domain-containing protein [Tumidithrix helvetica PCC 7403]|uniref:DUF4255 domain-containing protein n=1 Tax=Tumidithrix helvetica TaxID=3457545 RepID=UPI003C841C08